MGAERLAPRDPSADLAELDALIRAGSIDRARVQLQTLMKDVPPKQLAAAAALCRRVGRPEWALRALTPLVRPEGRKKRTASPEDVAEHAAALTEAGAPGEALRLLASLEKDAHPRAHLFEAFAHMHRWDYALAVPALRRFIELEAPGAYLITVARVNLAAALIFERRLDEAETCLSALLAEIGASSNRLLLANIHELRAQRCALAGDSAGARAALVLSSEVVGESDPRGRLWLRKWKAIVDLGDATIDRESAIAELRAVRDEALRNQVWETVRDCDLRLARASRDGELLLHLYFGSPFRAYRNRVAAVWNECFGASGFPPSDLRHRIGGEGEPAFELAVGNGVNDRSSQYLKVGQLPQRLLHALCLDFYRPARIASLHAAVFPDGYYHPIHSTAVIHQGILRLRLWFRKAGLPLDIVHAASGYRLEARRPGTLLIPLPDRDGTVIDPVVTAAVERLKQAFPVGPFGSAEAAKLLKIHPRTLVRLLADALKAGLLTSQGRGRATRYTPKK